MAVFSKWLSFAILAVAAFVFVMGVLLRDYTVTEMFMAAVGLAVAAIPEGLPAIVTITLAIGVQRMARRNAIVRVLPAVEALGSVTCICSDKTGTLTRNEMTVQVVATAERSYRVTGVGYAPRGEFLHAGQAITDDHPVLREALRAALLCNDAGLRRHEDQWVIDGDPTEAALVVAAAKFGFEADYEGEASPRTDVIPFESEHRFMATLHHDHTGHAFIYLKGAPERVLEMCRYERVAGEDRPIHRDFWRERAEAIAAEGQRVLACAFKPARPDDRDLDFHDVDDGLTLLALFGMVDPPREEAIRAVAACHGAGIDVKMITGDHAATARAIAARLGIGDGRTALTGVELQGLSDTALRELVADVDVYARVSPEHKLRLVTALQARGEVVAMTGDGVNDAPALKRADIGVAMGITGTEVAKEAAEMVLADDNFASIANAVEEGRTVYDNLRKAILFILPTNAGEALSLVVAIAFGMVLPILPVQILWVNMVTAVTLSLALAFEPTEAGTMRRPPRDPRAPIFSAYFLWRTVLVSLVLVAGTLGMFVWTQAQGATLEAARTAAVNTLVTFEVFYLLNTRYLLQPAWPHRAFSGNPYIPLSIGVVVLAQLLYTYAPFMQAMFHTTAIGVDAWLRIVSIAASIFIIVELEKVLARRLRWQA
jgi:magnesium-transporting ATPase (P-type)